MRTRARLATIVVGGALATALLSAPGVAAGQPAAATADRGTPGAQATTAPRTCDGTAAGAGGANRPADRAGRQGQGGAGAGRAAGAGMGAGTNLAGVASGTLTDAQRSTLASIAEDEKLAHDLYVAFADQYSAAVFTRIATAETRHLAAVRVLLDRYDIADPTADLPAGTFASSRFQDLYDAQLAAGSADLAAAYRVGVLVETTDIADLAAAATGLTAPDVQQVYARLLAGSEHHLVAFGG